MKKLFLFLLSFFRKKTKKKVWPDGLIPICGRRVGITRDYDSKKTLPFANVLLWEAFIEEGTGKRVIKIHGNEGSFYKVEQLRCYNEIALPWSRYFHSTKEMYEYCRERSFVGEAFFSPHAELAMLEERQFGLFPKIQDQLQVSKGPVVKEVCRLTHVK